jgi:putative toxin-antitoxin system antitoxin component (TIGR02293 family)
MIGERAVLIDRVGDRGIDAARFELACVGSPHVEILAAMPGCGVHETCAGIVRHVIARKQRAQMTRKPVYPVGFAETAVAFEATSARIIPGALSDLARQGYSEEEIFSLVVPKRTLARRKAANELLTIEETDKALRLARIAAQAERVFGEAEKAHRWLRKPKRALQDEMPLAYLASEAGARVVEEMLHRIEHGIFA